MSDPKQAPVTADDVATFASVLREATYFVEAEALESILTERDAALKALTLTQWGFNHRRCPVCAGFNVGPNGETDYRHTLSCPVAVVLAKGGKSG